MGHSSPLFPLVFWVCCVLTWYFPAHIYGVLSASASRMKQYGTAAAAWRGKKHNFYP